MRKRGTPCVQRLAGKRGDRGRHGGIGDGRLSRGPVHRITDAIWPAALRQMDANLMASSRDKTAAEWQGQLRTGRADPAEPLELP